MMISLDLYLNDHSEDSYEELIAEREKLIAEIRDFEQRDRAANQSEDFVMVCPDPEVVYQTNLQYLSVLCRRISEVYNRDFVWGDDWEDEDE